MKLNEFSKRIGLPLTKLRYYARTGITQPERHENNYRDFDVNEALDIYNALMLRSYDMNVEDIASLHYGNKEIDIGDYLTEQIDDLEGKIQSLQVRVNRLKEVQDYIKQFHHLKGKPYLGIRYSEHVIWSFDETFKLDQAIEKQLRILTDCSPFSYIALKVPENIWKTEEVFGPIIGIGILAKNLSKAGINIPENSVCTEDKGMIGIYFEKENIFEMKKEDLKPIFQFAKDKNVELTGDLSGRFYLSYNKDGKRVYCYAMGIGYREKD